MTNPSSSHSGQPSIWPTIAPYMVPPVAASTAIMPVFYGFVVKSAKQLGNPIPRMSALQALSEGYHAAPTIGAIVGTQLIVQRVVEKMLVQGENRQPSFASMVFSSIIVGAVSAPGLAAFNGQTMGRSISDSLKSLTAKQTAAIVVRETSFLFSLRISEPVCESLKEKYGENKAVELTALFASGAIGSLVGHPADTALTLWQKERQLTSLHQSMNGALIKAATVGLFAVTYNTVKEQLRPRTE